MLTGGAPTPAAWKCHQLCRQLRWARDVEVNILPWSRPYGSTAQLRQPYGPRFGPSAADGRVALGRVLFFTYLHSDRVNPNFIAHADSEDLEMVCGRNQAHILIQHRKNDSDRPGRNVIEGGACHWCQLGQKKGDEGDEHCRHSGDDEEGLAVP